MISRSISMSLYIGKRVGFANLATRLVPSETDSD